MPPPIVQPAACQRRRRSCQIRNRPRLGLTAMAAAMSSEPAGRSSQRHAATMGRSSSRLTLPRSESFRPGRLKATTATAAARSGMDTGISAQAVSRAPTRSSHHRSALSVSGTPVNGSTATPSGGA